MGVFISETDVGAYAINSVNFHRKFGIFKKNLLYCDKFGENISENHRSLKLFAYMFQIL